MKNVYSIVKIEDCYTYRSYMACEEQREDDCVAYRTYYQVRNKYNKPLRSFSDESLAKAYIRKLKKRYY